MNIPTPKAPTENGEGRGNTRRAQIFQGAKFKNKGISGGCQETAVSKDQDRVAGFCRFACASTSTGKAYGNPIRGERPGDLYEALRKRARANHRSIAAEVITLLEEQVPTAAELQRRRSLGKRLERLRSLAPLGAGPISGE